jgi:hypothetical protein
VTARPPRPGDNPPSAIIIGAQAGMTGFGNGGGFAGSVADIQLFRNGLTQVGLGRIVDLYCHPPTSHQIC